MPLIVGDLTDVHVAAVVERLQTPPTLLNAAFILDHPFSVSADGIEAAGVRIEPRCGWLRRLAPEGWAESMNDPGRHGAARAAAMSALASIARDERINWLTPLDVLGGAENKPFQYRRAAAAGVPVPEWVVTTDVNRVPRCGEWVSKPLGPGYFIDESGTGWVVPTSAVDLNDRATIIRVRSSYRPESGPAPTPA